MNRLKTLLAKTDDGDKVLLLENDLQLKKVKICQYMMSLMKSQSNKHLVEKYEKTICTYEELPVRFKTAANLYSDFSVTVLPLYNSSFVLWERLSIKDFNTICSVIQIQICH